MAKQLRKNLDDTSAFDPVPSGLSLASGNAVGTKCGSLSVIRGRPQRSYHTYFAVLVVTAYCFQVQGAGTYL